MGSSIEISSHNFVTDVLEKSYEKPVLVDFFAQWCGPCQMLKPILEKLAQEYDFILAKVDIDHSPDLANDYGIQGVPDVRVVTQGEVKEGFVGVLPEPKLRELLTQLNLKSKLEQGLEAVHAAIATDDIETAKSLFNQLIEAYPEDRRLILEAAKFLISQNKLESAAKLLAVIQEDEKPYFAEAQAVKTLIQFKQDDASIDEGDRSNGNDLDTLFTKASRLTLAEDYEAALQLFLEIVGRDRKYKNDGARKAMIAIFDLLGDGHPLTRSYRKQLMLTLY